MLRALAISAALVLAGAVGTEAAPAAPPLQLTVYNPGGRSIFPVSSDILAGRHDAILIDAQFQRNDAEAVVKRIKAGGKRLTTVYISHSDPDYYFGLDVIHAAFPKARIVATAPTVAAIHALAQRKFAYWGPILRQNAPRSIVYPTVLAGNHLTLEGRRLDIEGLDGPTPARSFVWIPSLKTVVGGAVVFSGTHVWVADTPTTEARKQWQATLAMIVALHPVRVVPGHYLGDEPPGLDAVSFTSDYLHAFDEEKSRATTAASLITAMEKRYPNLPDSSWLELGAKVVKGDMRWPQ